jgi:hypothetical protein
VPRYCNQDRQLRVDSWNNESVVRYSSVRTLAGDIVRISYQETTSEDTVDFMCAAVTMIFTMCKPLRLL